MWENAGDQAKHQIQYHKKCVSGLYISLLGSVQAFSALLGSIFLIEDGNMGNYCS